MESGTLINTSLKWIIEKLCSKASILCTGSPCDLNVELSLVDIRELSLPPKIDEIPQLATLAFPEWSRIPQKLEVP